MAGCPEGARRGERQPAGPAREGGAGAARFGNTRSAQAEGRSEGGRPPWLEVAKQWLVGLVLWPK